MKNCQDVDQNYRSRVNNHHGRMLIVWKKYQHTTFNDVTYVYCSINSSLTGVMEWSYHLMELKGNRQFKLASAL